MGHLRAGNPKDPIFKGLQMSCMVEWGLAWLMVVLEYD